jgi:hypothetical protein
MFIQESISLRVQFRQISAVVSSFFIDIVDKWIMKNLLTFKFMVLILTHNFYCYICLSWFTNFFIKLWSLQNQYLTLLSVISSVLLLKFVCISRRCHCRKHNYHQLIFIRCKPIFAVFIGIRKPQKISESWKAYVTIEVMSKYQNHEFKCDINER